MSSLQWFIIGVIVGAGVASVGWVLYIYKNMLEMFNEGGG